MKSNQPATSSLENKVVVITGASSGVGRAAAMAFARQGVTLILTARGIKALQEITEECQSMGVHAIAIPTDISDSDAVAKLVESAIEFEGKIDIWVNNAGVLAAGALDDTPIEVIDQVIKTNLLGYIHGAHAVLPYFKEQGFGTIINNISVGGWLPTPYATGYTASKYGLVGFSEALKGELLPFPNIHVCDLFPAFLDTPGMRHAANYTGAVLKTPPPAFDPEKVADAMVSLALNPRSKTTTDALAPALKVIHSLFPSLMRNTMASLMSYYFKKAKTAQLTAGNVNQPVDYWTSIHGGWQMSSQTKKKVATGTLIVAGLIGCMLLLKKDSSN